MQRSYHKVLGDEVEVTQNYRKLYVGADSMMGFQPFLTIQSHYIFFGTSWVFEIENTLRSSTVCNVREMHPCFELPLLFGTWYLLLSTSCFFVQLGSGLKMLEYGLQI